MLESALVHSRLANRGADQRAPAGGIGHGDPGGYDEWVTVCFKCIISRLAIISIADFVDT